MNIEISQLMYESGVKFGTSGARGLADAMTDQVVYCYTGAFIKHLSECGYLGNSKKICIAGDLRPSTPRIMAAVATSAAHLGFDIEYCGLIPTPALVLYAMENSLPSIMVTGSHIPDDRNGIKFHRPDGEIDKTDEGAIKSSLMTFDDALFDSNGLLKKPYKLEVPSAKAEEFYQERWVSFFGSECLMGLNLGVYQHSTVGRDHMVEILKALGASVTPLGRSKTFIPVDTEAIRPEDVQLAHDWCAHGEYDAIISADGDCDRPLLSTEQGDWIRGDILGILTAHFLGADAVATPVSCNSALEKSSFFNAIERTQIGSPFVISGMQSLSHKGNYQVVGYEANGGFLQWSRIYKEGMSLESLPTRDPMIAVISCLVSAQEQKLTLSELVAQLPSRFTLSDRLQEVPQHISDSFLSKIHPESTSASFKEFEKVFTKCTVKDFNELDGLRFTLVNDDVIHLRKSGNAPELRCYVESSSLESAQLLLKNSMDTLSRQI